MYYLFDFDGTLITPMNINYTQLKQKIADKLKLKNIDSTVDDIYQYSSEPYKIFKIIDEYECEALQYSSLNEKIIEMYKESNPRIIISRNGFKVIDMFFREHRLPYPDFISCRDNTRFLKPNIYQLNSIVKKFPFLNNTNITIVGDSWHDFTLARNYNALFFQVTNK